RRRQARPALLGWGLAAAALLAVAVGLALVRPAAASPAPWTLLAEGAPERGLAPGSALELPAGATLRAADGTTLVAGGAVRLALGAQPMRIALHAGSIEARVERQPAQHPLVITTAEAEVAVVGTRFRLAREDAGTRLEMSEGCVRLTRLADGGSELVRAGATVAVAARPAEPAWQPLFPAEGLEGWNPEHGRWDNRQGVVTGGAEGAAKARLASRQSLGDCELTCRLRISGGLHQAEIQVGDYNWFVTVPAATTADGWVAVRLSQRQGRLQASADGRALVPEPGAGAAPRRGALAFYAAPGVTVSIADARLRTWP
ncbi:MAG: FecR domain-containing protein, partial [Planctomycetes bacterium]|nr:FecR domain-containing protein [Planctomycetota bacterium]